MVIGYGAPSHLIYLANQYLELITATTTAFIINATSFVLLLVVLIFLYGT